MTLHDTFETVEHVLYVREHILFEHARHTLGTQRRIENTICHLLSLSTKKSTSRYMIYG